MIDEVKGFYGASDTPCTVFIYRGWYAVEGSTNVNYCPALNSANIPASYPDGLYVEGLEDTGHFTASSPIEDAEQLEEEVES